jgi:competence protein ComEA
MPTFSRAQLKIILLVAGLLFGLYAGRGYLGWLSWQATASAHPAVFVEVTGEVARPGVYAFPASPTLPGVWRQAGGPMPLPLSETPLPSQTRLEVRREGDYHLDRMSGERLLTLGSALDLNTATAEDLDALPGIGPALAQRIVQYRQSQGPYRTIEDLLAVHGIGEKKLAQLKPLLMVSSPPE